MFHEVGLQQWSGFFNEKSYKYVISENEFINLLKYSINISRSRKNISYEYTFDDGGISNLQSAETLTKLGLLGIFFIPTKFIGVKGFLSKENIWQIRQLGHIIGTHTHNHPMFLNKFRYELQSIEWLKSIEILEDILGEKILLASAPNGFFNNHTFEILSKTDVRGLYSSLPSSNVKIKRNGVKLFGRSAIKFNNNNFQTVSNSFFKQKKELFRYQILKFVKGLMPFYWNKL